MWRRLLQDITACSPWHIGFPRTVKLMKTNHTIEQSESALAVDEFAAWIDHHKPLQNRDHYEVRPCKLVRGFMLRLPGIGWKLWFPTSVAAVIFARRAALIYLADCLVYDSTGRQIC